MYLLELTIYLLGLTMYLLSLNVNYYLGQRGDGEEDIEPNITMLTAMFFFLNFLAATQVNNTSSTLVIFLVLKNCDRNFMWPFFENWLLFTCDYSTKVTCAFPIPLPRTKFV